MIAYRKARVGDEKRIKEVMDEGIGENFYSENQIKEFIENEHESVIMVGVDELDVPHGFIYSFVAPLKEALSILGIPKDHTLFSDMDEDEMVGVMKTTSTDKAHRKDGICVHLVENTAVYMKEKKVKQVIVSALRRPDGYVVTEGLLDATGYRPVMELKRPWNKIDCFCPHCKKQYCECDSVVYIRELQES